MLCYGVRQSESHDGTTSFWKEAKFPPSVCGVDLLPTLLRSAEPGKYCCRCGSDGSHPYRLASWQNRSSLVPICGPLTLLSRLSYIGLASVFVTAFMREYQALITGSTQRCMVHTQPFRARILNNERGTTFRDYPFQCARRKGLSSPRVF